MTSQLPHFEDPPLIEVVCGVQFETLPGLGTAHYGLFWDRVREGYPDAEDKPPLAEVLEPVKGSRPPQEREVVLEIPPLRRVFFIDESTNYLLQVQPSRFLSNWRKVRGDDQYPRFDAAYERFVSGWREFQGFADEMELGPIRTNQFELTYINHFSSSGEFPAEWPSFLRASPWPVERDFLPSPVAAAAQMTFRLPEDRGLLRVSINHGRREADGKQVMVVEFTARGPALVDCSNQKDWFSTAHEWIVRGFTDLTSKPAHNGWGRIQ